METVILRLRDLGFFEFLLPFMLSSAVFYGLLRRSQLFGTPERNVAVNAVVSLMVAFMVWAYPIIAGVSLEQGLSKFFVQGFIAMLVMTLGVSMIGVLFPEGLAKELNKKVGGGIYITIITISVLVFAGLLFTSGLSEVLFPSATLGLGTTIPWDVVLTIVIVIILGAIIFAISVAGGGKGPKEEEKPKT
jgi:hypothetical protein